MKKLRFSKDSTKKDPKTSAKQSSKSDSRRSSSSSNRRRSSDLQTSYLLPPPITKQPQKSDFVKNLQIEPPPARKGAKFVVEHNKKVYKVYYPDKDRHDYHDAADFYHRSEGLPMRNQSMDNLRKSYSRRGTIDRTPRPSTSKGEGRFSAYQNPMRCRKCLQLKDDCVCSSDSMETAHNSDWMKVLLPNEVKNRFEPNSHRLKWLEELEDNPEFNKRELLKEKLDELDVCCFPFSTGGLFNKKKGEGNWFLRESHSINMWK